ncbi:MAG: response regulator transcription factor [Austwickia sp.]|nr:response regulator transcription factor [Actinomycetota bacterium]MCO5310630.1 response regulator transcription factor [Austwickia sp.]
MTMPPPQDHEAAPTRLVLVDDDALVRAGLRLILGGSPDLEVVGEAADGAAGLAEIERTRPDIVLMDVRMPRMDGLTATRTLLAHAGAPKVIVLTTFDADELVLGALVAGASGFLLKDTHPADMVAAIRAVRRGEHTLSPSIMSQVIATATATATGHDAAATRRDAALARLATLTDREREVALAVGRGLSNAEIAGTLFMSVATVKGHVSHVFEKLDAQNRVQIALTVHDAGLA